MHHISDPEKIIHQSYRLLKKNGTIYIFEPLFREVHQYPEDYFRFTPYGLIFLLKKKNFKNEKYKTIGISSGASAPEILVENFINNLKKQFTVAIEEIEIVKENITFKIPGKLN